MDEAVYFVISVPGKHSYLEVFREYSFYLSELHAMQENNRFVIVWTAMFVIICSCSMSFSRRGGFRKRVVFMWHSLLSCKIFWSNFTRIYIHRYNELNRNPISPTSWQVQPFFWLDDLVLSLSAVTAGKSLFDYYFSTPCPHQIHLHAKWPWSLVLPVKTAAIWRSSCLRRVMWFME